MRNVKKDFGKSTALILTLLLLTLVSTGQEKRRETTLGRKFDVGRGMSVMTTDLMQVAAGSDLFLQFDEEIKLTVAQRKKLEDVFFDVQKFSLLRQTDLDVAEAELRRLLSSDSVDLLAVRGKLKQIESLRAEMTMKNIEAALQAIAVLTHDQHLKVMLLVRRLLEQKMPQAAPQG